MKNEINLKNVITTTVRKFLSEQSNTLKTVKDVIKLINDERFRYDGTGDGDFFDGSSAKLIYSSNQLDFGYHILEG